MIGSGVQEIGNILTNDGLAIPDKISDDLAKSVGEILDKQGKVLLEHFREGKRTIAKFRESLKEFLAVASQKDQPLPLFVLIDELDRCRPPFAIAMLERVKHLFEIDQVIFVLATDTTQLSHSITGVYGGGFNSTGYLSRFFNRTYFFERVSKTSFVEDLLAKMPIESAKLSLPSSIELERYLTEGFDFFGLSLRDIEQVYDILRNAVTAWNSRLKIEICLLFPIAVAQQQNFSLALDNNFSSALNRLHEKLGGDESWTIQFASRNYRHEPSDSTSAVSLASEFVAQSERALNELNYEHTAPHARWVTQRLSEEFQIAHGNSWRSGSAPISIIRRYPDLVRSAGRLLPRVPEKA